MLGCKNIGNLFSAEREGVFLYVAARIAGGTLYQWVILRTPDRSRRDADAAAAAALKSATGVTGLCQAASRPDAGQAVAGVRPNNASLSPVAAQAPAGLLAPGSAVGLRPKVRMAGMRPRTPESDARFCAVAGLNHGCFGWRLQRISFSWCFLGPWLKQHEPSSAGKVMSARQLSRTIGGVIEMH
ncbi:hypothetical protein MAC_03692 [Metarhizium acridum CQMa 102]|uniref:Uncharacterized protein n=1 Tax=Metarhizium acridum (strain CQMa 102) TaxID=655827 RepID=E9E1E4_METAQ|nr:uncharacterized protein MAC_03692 [Metarhizium acridum CQMa 102]EFY90177.1 hypothetical protein MAC_03692 [Metarhizium acridum CQMa 102]